MAEIGKPGTPQVTRVYSGEFTLDPTLIHDTHSDLLRGLVWCAGLVKDDNLIVSVGDAAAICFKKIPGIGPRSRRLATPASMRFLRRHRWPPWGSSAGSRRKPSMPRSANNWPKRRYGRPKDRHDRVRAGRSGCSLLWLDRGRRATACDSAT